MSDNRTATDTWTEYEKALATANTAKKSAVFDALTTAGITSVTVNFNGEGDSGQIEEVVAFVGDTPQKLPDVAIPVQDAAYGRAESAASARSLADSIETLCYDYLSQEHGGWENNDGAFGEFTLNVADRTVELEFNGRYSEFHTTTHTF